MSLSPTPEEALEGELVAGKYLVERVLGRGGMGVVYLARHVELDEHVAVKLMLPEAAKSSEAVARFLREARAAAKIKSQHVVRVSDVGMRAENQPYMAMEYLEGTDLRQMLTARQRLPLEETAEYLLQALEALAEAHALGIVHRDLKPGNLFVTRRRDGTPIVKVLDFGISKIIPGALSPSDPLTNVSALMGSPLYMSPEQMKASRNVDMRADIWALGVIFYELLTGDVPFNGDSLTELCALIVLEAEPPRAREHVPELPEAVDDVIARCLSRRLDQRFANAAELARALAPFAPVRARVSVDRIVAAFGPEQNAPPASAAAAVSTESATHATWSETAPLKLTRRGTVLAAAGVGALLLAGGAAFFGHRTATNPASDSRAAAPAEPAAGVTTAAIPAAVAASAPATPTAPAPESTTSASAAPPKLVPESPTSASSATPRKKPGQKTPDFGGRR